MKTMKIQITILTLCLAITCFICAIMGSDVKDLKNRVTELEYMVNGE